MFIFIAFGFRSSLLGGRHHGAALLGHERELEARGRNCGAEEKNEENQIFFFALYYNSIVLLWPLNLHSYFVSVCICRKKFLWTDSYNPRLQPDVVLGHGEQPHVVLYVPGQVRQRLPHVLPQPRQPLH